MSVNMVQGWDRIDIFLSLLLVGNGDMLSCQMENDEIGTDMLCKMSYIGTLCTIYAFYKFLLALYLSFFQSPFA